MSSNRVINLNPKFTDVIKLDPSERVIELSKGKKGLYLNIDYIECLDRNLNAQRRIIHGGYISQYAIDTIRVRNHYPHIPGRAWNKSGTDLSQMKPLDQNKNGKSLKSPADSDVAIPRLNFFSHDYGIYINVDEPSGNVSLKNSNNIKVVNQCAFKETLFTGYRDGVSVEYPNYGIEETLYHAMYYSYQSPYAPVLNETLYYYYDSVTDINVGDWQEVDVLNKNTRKWQIEIDLEPFYAKSKQQLDKTNDYFWLYGSNFNSKKIDPRVQFLEFQIITKTGKIGTRIYYLFHIPQCIPKLHAGYHYSNTVGLNTLYDGKSAPEYEIEPGSYIISTNSYTPIYTNCAFVTKGTTYSNLVPLPFPLNTEWIEKQITITSVVPSNQILTLYHPAIQGSIQINGQDFKEKEYNSDIVLNENEFTITNYQIPRLTKEGFLTNCGTVILFSGDNVGSGVSITYDTPVIDPKQLKKVMSVAVFHENGIGEFNPPFRPLLDENNIHPDYYGSFHKWDLEDIICYNQYYLYNENWYQYSYHEFWIMLDLTDSEYLPCGDDFSHYTRLWTYETKLYSERLEMASYSIYTKNWWNYGEYSNYSSPLKLQNEFPDGRISFPDPDKEARYLYKQNGCNHSDSTPTYPVIIPEDPEGWFMFSKGREYGCVISGIYGTCNDGSKTRAFINCVPTTLNRACDVSTIVDDWREHHMIFLPLINIQNPPDNNAGHEWLSFGLQPDYDNETKQYEVIPIPANDVPQKRNVVLNSVSLANYDGVLAPLTEVTMQGIYINTKVDTQEI